MISRYRPTLGSLLFLALLLTPYMALLALAKPVPDLDRRLLSEAQANTAILALGSLSVATGLGLFFSAVNAFCHYPLKKWVHSGLMLPLALPAYILAYIYLAAAGPSSDLSDWVTLQGSLSFLVAVLGLSLTPYVYYFCFLAFNLVTQSEWETESILQAGPGRFFSMNVWPKLAPSLVSAQILVLFESLSDFGAASMVNVPVMTTMIYKLWFDLFSFEGAVQFALKYSFVILFLLVFEVLQKSLSGQPNSTQRDPLRGVPLRGPLAFMYLMVATVYLGFAFAFPVYEILKWSLKAPEVSIWWQASVAVLRTLGLGVVVGLCTVLFASVLLVRLRKQRRPSKPWVLLSTLGYSMPGSLLAVAVYGVLLTVLPSIGDRILISALIFGMSYKFLTVTLRSVAESVDCWPQSLFEISAVNNVGFLKRLTTFYYPYLKSSTWIALLMVSIEVMKEMPFTLMLAPSGFQTLSIQIFNFTSEGEWEKAAVPSLMLALAGVLSVTFLNRKTSEVPGDS